MVIFGSGTLVLKNKKKKKQVLIFNTFPTQLYIMRKKINEIKIEMSRYIKSYICMNLFFSKPNLRKKFYLACSIIKSKAKTYPKDQKR